MLRLFYWVRAEAETNLVSLGVSQNSWQFCGSVIPCITYNLIYDLLIISVHFCISTVCSKYCTSFALEGHLEAFRMSYERCNRISLRTTGVMSRG